MYPEKSILNRERRRKSWGFLNSCREKKTCIHNVFLFVLRKKKSPSFCILGLYASPNRWLFLDTDEMGSGFKKLKFQYTGTVFVSLVFGMLLHCFSAIY